MFELLFIIAIIALGIIQCLIWISNLPAAPTIAFAAIAAPLLAYVIYQKAAALPSLAFLKRRGVALPPDHASWTIARRRLRPMVFGCLALSLAAWPLAILFPAQLNFTATSLAGWLTGLLGTGALGAFLGLSLLYLRASQKLDPMLPNPVGVLRRWAYRISDNPEFLGNSYPDRERKERSVY